MGDYVKALWPFAVVAVLLFVTAAGGCTLTDQQVAHAVRANGLIFEKSTGYRWFACGKGDEYNSGFVAKNPSGYEVTGVVCGGLMKSYTVRYD